MNHDYKPVEPQPQPIARCPCCGSGARVWSYVDAPGASMERVVMCDHLGVIGPRDDTAKEACLLQTPPSDFYRPTVREALQHWNEYAEALEAIRGERRKHIYWGAGEADCPREIKAPNGELHTLQCKKCGKENPSGDCAVWQRITPELTGAAKRLRLE